MCRETIAVYSGNETKPINALYEKRTNLQTKWYTVLSFLGT